MKKGALLFPGIPEMEAVRKRLIVQYWKETTAQLLTSSGVGVLIEVNIYPPFCLLTLIPNQFPMGFPHL